MPSYVTHASPRTLYLVRSTPEPDYQDAHGELLRRLLLARSNNPDAAIHLESQKNINEAINKAKSADKGPTANAVLDALVAQHNKGATSSSQTGSEYTGSVSKLDKHAAPHRDGKPSSPAGPASSSGRKHH
ncbi:hypothetical protein OC842_003445 [Tilletia horrida]|uniref:Uncharacterized protein n=1 Tax=Tilletia horrida TaxID=155126 RepID=A0AAN6JKF6_9BASI|nr:hypothetical protein OC842_003445 [Tilletia horrida]